MEQKQINKYLKEAKFILLQKDSKHPVKDETTGSHKYSNLTEAQDHLNKGYAVGIVAGDKLNPDPEAQEGERIFFIDCDELELDQYCDQILPPTYTQSTPTGLHHYVFRTLQSFENQGIEWNNKHLGELRADNQYIVIAPSKAFSKRLGAIGSYQVVKDMPLAYISSYEIDKLLQQFGGTAKAKAEGGVLTPDLLAKVQADQEILKLFEGDTSGFASRSEAEQSLTNKLRARDFTKEEAYKIVANSKIGKLKEKPISYWELMWDKSLNFVTSGKKEYISKIAEAEPLELMTVLDCKNHKICKDYIIKDLKYPKENEMIVAPSGSFKSIIALYQAVCIASGKEFLGKKTKKSGVLFIPAETSKDWLKTKLEMILRGLKLRSNKLPIYFLTREHCEDLLSPSFTARLCKTIKDKDIKVLFLDTINPLTPSIDDNAAKDVTRLFNEFIKPVIDLYGCNITFLHHTDKKGENYLGSMKWFANCDQVFRLDRKDLSHQVTFFNEKNRRGETKTLEIELIFSDKKIEFKLLAEKDPSKFNKKHKMTQQEFFILKLNEFFGDREDIERAEAMQVFKENKIKFSTPTFDRAWKVWRKE